MRWLSTMVSLFFKGFLVLLFLNFLPWRFCVPSLHFMRNFWLGGPASKWIIRLAHKGSIDKAFLKLVQLLLKVILNLGYNLGIERSLNVVYQCDSVIIWFPFFLNIYCTAFLLYVSLEKDAINDSIKSREVVCECPEFPPDITSHHLLPESVCILVLEQLGLNLL